eukprot:TRINITY_DN1733_c0_g1_i8.p1 TRINITY_DN1733_c0_g1~~TRINITY_DN1733_c0_g1_i8.p1  ORF type:complete len:149 (-),score=24.40 TRINITY_DN1733_c0_g1_i8:239-685(-)
MDTILKKNFFSPSQVVGEVVAIDPADLKIPLNPNIKHLKLKAEEALPLLPKRSFDLIVCDINRYGHILYDILAKVEPLLKEGGYILVTLKMLKRTVNSAPAVLEKNTQEFLKVLPDFDVVKILWLLSNSHERCLIARRKFSHSDSQQK